jgi:hypothetical protein
MKKSDLKTIVAKGEDSHLQFKKDIRNADALAAEMVAFSNSEGGRILIGVTDAGEPAGVPREEVGRINQLISNAASQHVRSPISPIPAMRFISPNILTPRTLPGRCRRFSMIPWPLSCEICTKYRPGVGSTHRECPRSRRRCSRSCWSTL